MTTNKVPIPPPLRGTIKKRDNKAFEKLTAQTRNRKDKNQETQTISTNTKDSFTETKENSLNSYREQSEVNSNTPIHVNNGARPSSSIDRKSSMETVKRRPLSTPPRYQTEPMSHRDSHKITSRSKYNDSLETNSLYGYVPIHLRGVNYKNDIFEVLKDKVEQCSSSFHNSFIRLNKSVGATGWRVPKEDFKKALIKDFHLFEDTTDGDTLEHIEIRKYQEQQKRELDKFIDEAASNNDGYIRYDDFVRAIKNLDKKVSIHSTTTERQARYSSTMSNQIKNIIEAKKKQRQEKAQMKPPPFAMYDETENYEYYYYEKYKERLKALRSCFSQVITVDGCEKVLNRAFVAGLLKFDRYLTEREANEMISFLDSKKRGYIDLKEFMDRFAIHILNSKSLRGTCETGFMHMYWPKSLEETAPRAETMEKLREQKAKHVFKSKSKPTRTSFLRKEETLRSRTNSNRSSLSAIGKALGKKSDRKSVV